MLISVYQTSSFLTPWIFLPLKVPKTCEMNKWQTVLLFFSPVSHTIILLPISVELHFGHHKDVTKDAASPSLHAAWGKAGLHSQFRLMRILLSMRSSGGSWAYISEFTYILIFYPLKAKETHGICMCTCALHVHVCMQYCMYGGQRMTPQSPLSPFMSIWVLRRSKLRFLGLHNKHIYLLNHLTAPETFGIITMSVRTRITNSHRSSNCQHLPKRARCTHPSIT